MRQSASAAAWLFLAVTSASACIWDADTLADEKKKSPEMAALVLGTHRSNVETNALLRKIETLKAGPRQNDPAWWNDLAGAYLRLGRAQEAATLLEPLLTKFPNDYGVHANLGTAYHLLGRYQDAEREIARDLELNTNAHFGLEVYHLALLQYLCRDKYYQSRHAYVDEFTPVLLREHEIIRPSVPDDLAGPFPPPTTDEIDFLKQQVAEVSSTNRSERGERLLALAVADPPPPYRLKWNLAYNPNFTNGVRYMAELNSSESACFVMLGLACLHAQDLNLAARAFERAIALGSPQRQILEDRIAEINEHIRHARANKYEWMPSVGKALVIGAALYVSFRLVRRMYRLLLTQAKT